MMGYDLIDTAVSASGTFLVGNVKTTYTDLVETLGEPHHTMGDKVTAEWDLKFEDEDGHQFVATIYDWKTTSTPMGEYAWHIGGHSQEAVWAVQDLLGVYA